MSQFYDQASLVMVPSGYKNGKVYSQKPLSTSGELSFTRASNATRVNSSGLVEKVRENQYYKSTAMVSSSLFATYNATPTSLGTYPVYSDSLAYSYVITGTNQGFIVQLPSDSNIRSLSVYLKDFGTVDLYYTGSAPLNTISDAGTINGYKRYVVVLPAGANNLYFRPNSNDGTPTTCYSTAPQIEYGDIATTYISNDTTASVVSVGPVSGLPRLDYSGGCPSLLLEPQRSNSITFSEQMDNAAWTIGSATLSSNATISPSGYQDADNIITTAANSFAGPTSISISANTATYTQSIFVKWISGHESFKLRSALTGGTSVAKASSFNVRTGVINSTDTTAQITDYGNGWYRVSQQITNNGTNTNFIFQLFPSNDAVNTNTIAFWGAQVEEGAYATSYIPTLSTAVTRVKDEALTASVPSLIGQTEGTLYVEWERVSTLQDMFVILSNIAGTSSAAYFNSVYLFQIANGNLVVENYVSAVQQFGFTKTGGLSVGTHKIAVAYKANDFVCYVDGVQIGTDTSGSVPAMNYLTIGGGADVPTSGQSIKQTLLFKTRLSNADLATLTTL